MQLNIDEKNMSKKEKGKENERKKRDKNEEIERKLKKEKKT